MPTESDKAACLEHYVTREPREFVQFDGFNPPTYVIAPDGIDEDGDELWGFFRTRELMHGSQVRVLIQPDTDPEVAVRFLKKITAWIERESITWDKTDSTTVWRLRRDDAPAHDIDDLAAHATEGGTQ